MPNKCKIIISLMVVFLICPMAMADDYQKAVKLCKGNKPCVAAYMRLLGTKAKLDACTADKKALQSTIDQLQFQSKDSCAPCSSEDNSGIPDSDGLPPSGDSGSNGSDSVGSSPICTKEILYKDKSFVIKKIEAMDVDPLSSITIQALKQGCILPNPNKSQFASGFLCAIQADPTLAMDNEVLEAIDNLEYIDMDSTNLCEEISQLP